MICLGYTEHSCVFLWTLQILTKYRKGWTVGKLSSSFSLEGDGLKGNLKEKRGNGWQAVINGPSEVNKHTSASCTYSASNDTFVLPQYSSSYVHALVVTCVYIRMCIACVCTCTFLVSIGIAHSCILMM